jgi:hypothetical protein
MTDTLTENTAKPTRDALAPRGRDKAARAQSKRSRRRDDRDDEDRDERERRQRQEEALDEALMNTFPASDPIAVEQPARAS